MNIGILSEGEKAQLLEILTSAQKAVVVCHKSPDGDALGSCLAWATILRQHYHIQATVVAPDNYPDFLRWLPENETIVIAENRREEVEKLLSEADTVFMLDLNQPSRTGEFLEPLINDFQGRRVIIDHHLAPIEEVDLLISRSELCSTCELVFRIVWELELFEQTDKKWATQMYCGLMTDTGGFTYNSERPEIFFIICQLLTRPINKDKIYRNVYNNYSSWAIRLRGYLMSQKLNVFEDKHACYFALSRMEMDEHHFIKGDVEGLVNIPLTIKGMKLSISLREDDRVDNKIWVSLRSVDDFPANLVAEKYFNGGGHLNAAGGHLDCSLSEACEIAKKAIKELGSKE